VRPFLPVASSVFPGSHRAEQVVDIVLRERGPALFGDFDDVVAPAPADAAVFVGVGYYPRWRWSGHTWVRFGFGYAAPGFVANVGYYGWAPPAGPPYWAAGVRPYWGYHPYWGYRPYWGRQVYRGGWGYRGWRR